MTLTLGQTTLSGEIRAIGGSIDLPGFEGAKPRRLHNLILDLDAAEEPVELWLPVDPATLTRDRTSDP
ncbi:MAG: hypothetical protein PGN34_04525 [Methylobacterium frigidaeris]